MKVLILNGSPRQGNTVTAINALKAGMDKAGIKDIVEIDTTNASVSPCVACDTCITSGQCIFDDDTNEVVNEAVVSDMIVFATPVYWWGITAQMKLVIDKLYSQGAKLKANKKKIGVIVIGEAGLEDLQYELIEKQFGCICDFMEWEIVFHKNYSAGAPADLSANKDAIAELENIGAGL